MNKNLVLIATVALTLWGCSSAPKQKPETAAATLVAPEPEEERLVTVPDRPFSSDTLYALLVAEVAIDRKRYDIALGNYVQQAISTNDLLVTARATHIARSLNAHQSALEMSQLWLDIDPESTEARYLASVELINANMLFEAFELSRKMLEADEPTNFENIAIQAEKADIKIIRALSEKYKDLLTQYKEDPNLWLGYSMLLLKMGEHEDALSTAEKATALSDNPIRSAFHETRVLHKMGKVELATNRLAELVEQHPKHIGLRARYARVVWGNSPRQAREQFQILHEQQPADGEILYSLALVEKDLGELDAAKARFEKLIARNQYFSAAHLHLGDILRTQKNVDEALDHYKTVESGPDYLNAMVNATQMLTDNGRRDEALALISAEKKMVQGPALEGLYMLTADVLSSAGQMNAAENTLTEGLEKFANSTRLLYARAMLYAQIDYISAAERDLKAVLTLKPENAAALNALGYTLADRTDRYQEAYEYIKQAYALTPDDPAVIDSMGWVAYRMGNYEEALIKLREAMRRMPDHEIAAHLGEVLWVTGQQKEAIAIWKQGLKLSPNSSVIHQTLNRLSASLE